MSSADLPRTSAAPASEAQRGPSGKRGHLYLMGVLLAAAVIVSGSRGLDSPWIQGDEHIFIANNADVTGDAPSPGPTGNRYIDLFFHAHEDLYQPVTILTYAIEWSFWGDNRVFHIRLTDVLIHLLNALLVWAAIAALLRRLCPDQALTAAPIAWSLALVWALHPMLVSAYAADMGRTHMLAATFALVSLLMHLRALQDDGGLWFAGAIMTLIAAMLCKPIVGWVAVVFAVEAALLGWRQTLRSPRVYLIAALCVLFAWLTLRTTTENLLLEESPLPLFGDPLARAALNLWISLRNFAAPLWQLSPWYPPDVRTGWDYPRVWLGAALTLATGVTFLLAMRRPKWRGVAIGLIWCLAMWLPVSGLVGAREHAARDRYFYLPAAGLLLVAGIVLLRWIATKPEASRRRVFVVGLCATALGAAALPWNMRLAATWRNSLLRAERAQKLNPDDPRIAELLAVAHQFALGHKPANNSGVSPAESFARTVRAYQHASALAEQNPKYFTDERARAAFHRRLAFSLWSMRQYDASLAEALRAREFGPDDALTWLRLAHSYRALERWNETRQAYEQMFQVLQGDARDRALRALEYADLLLNRFNDPRSALPYFREAIADSTLSHGAQRTAVLGAARCEVTTGNANDGYQLAITVLRAEPENVDAAAIIALFHLRSGAWTEAFDLYREIIRRRPTDYESLRGFQSACAELGRWADAPPAWQAALRQEPNNLVLKSYAIWSSACAADPSAAQASAELLEHSPGNRFACLANALLKLRSGELESSDEWVQRARQGDPLPQAREFVRTSAAIRVMLDREEVGPEATLIRAAILLEIDESAAARALVSEFIELYPESSWRPLADKIIGRTPPQSGNP